MLSINVRCLLSKLVVLVYILECLTPHILLLQETWLDESTPDVEIANYTCICRRDRAPTANRGGIATYVRNDIKSVVHLEKSDHAERAWHLCKLDIGSILIGNWYRPPGSNDDAIHSMRAELVRLSPLGFGHVVMGDMNIHHKKWLKYSNADSPEGDLLRSICDEFDLREHIKAPTRGKYLLDLCLSNIENTKASVKNKVSDHHVTYCVLPVPLPQQCTIRRNVWILRDAAWDNMKSELKRLNWNRLHQGSVHDAAKYLQSSIQLLCKRYIPYRSIEQIRSTYPWLNDRCRNAIRTKHCAEGTARYDECSQRCATVIAEEHQKYVEALKARIKNLSKNNKTWWTLNRQLRNHKCKISSVPPLRNDSQEWVTENSVKAQMFAKVWQDKCVLPPEVTEPYVCSPSVQFEDFVAIRVRHTLHELEHLNTSKTTGPDHISAHILKRLAGELAVPVTVLCRRMLREGIWPDIWRLHNLFPVFKRGASFLASNYRGVHITCILSKVAERVIAAPLIRQLQCTAFGINQWAFCKRRSARDLSTLLVSKWIYSICRGMKVGFFLSDISAAFDRVFKCYLMSKLYTAGIGDMYLRFLGSYLEARVGRVSVEGVFSELFVLADTVFQGTVLGPTLWNFFFADVSGAASE